MLMRRSLAIAVFALAPWLGSAAVARAEAPEGTYTLPLIAEKDTIVAPSSLDATGSDLCENDRELGEICVDLDSALSLVTGAGGKFDGTGSLEFTVSRDSDDTSLRGTLTGPVTGAIKGRADGSALNLKFAFKGDVGAGTLQLPARVTGTLKGNVSELGRFTGTQVVNLKVKGSPAVKRKLEISDLSLGRSFDWTLNLDVVNDSNGKLTGGARAVLADGGSFDFEIDGKYDARKDESSLKLKPRPGSKGAAISLSKLRTLGGGTLTYKLAGQSGKFKIE